MSRRHQRTVQSPPLGTPPLRGGRWGTDSSEPATEWRGAQGLALALMLATLLSAGGCENPHEPGEPIAALRVLGGLGDTPGRFTYPRCLDADASTLWAIDRSARVQRLDPITGRCLGLFRMPESHLGKPTGITVAPGLDERGAWTDTLLYIADTHYHRVMIYKPPAPLSDPNASREITPTLVSSFGAFGREGGEFIYPTHIAPLFSPASAGSAKKLERLYVSEYGGNDRVSVFEAGTNTFLFSFGSQGSSSDPGTIQFNRPQSIAIDTTRSGERRVVVVDACNHRVGVFTLEGVLIRWIGTPDALTPEAVPPPPSTTDLPVVADAPRLPPKRIATPGQAVKFLYPYGLELLGDGTALISEFGAARVQQIDLDTGICKGSWGRPGRREGELAAPWAVTTIGSTVYVLDSGNNRIVAFPKP